MAAHTASLRRAFRQILQIIQHKLGKDRTEEDARNRISSAVHSTTLHFSKRRRGPDSSSAHSVSSVGVRRPSVHLIKIEVVSLEPPQARFAGRHEMLARCSDIVWAEVRPVRELMAITALSRRPTSAARASEIRGRSARSKSR